MYPYYSSVCSFGQVIYLQGFPGDKFDILSHSHPRTAGPRGTNVLFRIPTCALLVLGNIILQHLTHYLIQRTFSLKTYLVVYWPVPGFRTDFIIFRFQTAVTLPEGGKKSNKEQDIN